MNLKQADAKALLLDVLMASTTRVAMTEFLERTLPSDHLLCPERRFRDCGPLVMGRDLPCCPGCGWTAGPDELQTMIAALQSAEAQEAVR